MGSIRLVGARPVRSFLSWSLNVDTHFAIRSAASFFNSSSMVPPLSIGKTGLRPFFGHQLRYRRQKARLLPAASWYLMSRKSEKLLTLWEPHVVWRHFT